VSVTGRPVFIIPEDVAVGIDVESWWFVSRVPGVLTNSGRPCSGPKRPMGLRREIASMYVVGNDAADLKESAGKGRSRGQMLWATQALLALETSPPHR
jgi:hypothetical protein